MSNWIYPNIIANMREVFDLYFRNKISTNDLQMAHYDAEQSIEAYEEHWLRQLFSDVENKIEEFKYTLSPNQQKRAIETVIASCISKLNDYEKI